MNNMVKRLSSKKSLSRSILCWQNYPDKWRKVSLLH